MKWHSKTLIASLAVTALLSGCKAQYKKPVIIWTDHPELVSYAELFNKTQNDVKAIVIYKEHVASAIPPGKDEDNPDILIGSWLKNSKIRKNFAPLDHLFSELQLNPDTIYQPLLSYGKANDHQYLLPVSFNLPVIIFSNQNKDIIPDDYILTPDQIRDTGTLFNKTTKTGIYTNMGIGPTWNPDFLYTLAKIHNVNFKEKGNLFSWDDQALAKCVTYIKDWTEEKNTSQTAEEDFKFKYLYTPDYRQVTSNRCLFAYTTSNRLFDISQELLNDIDFRWIANESAIFVEDDIVTMGLYRKSYNTKAAEVFILWLLREENQKHMLERSSEQKLSTQTFGIASGFSSIKNVNEHLFPSYYSILIGNLPPANAVKAPETLPARWPSLKERVIIPYLTDATKTDNISTIKSMDDRINIWIKQFN